MGALKEIEKNPGGALLSQETKVGSCPQTPEQVDGKAIEFKIKHVEIADILDLEFKCREPCINTECPLSDGFRHYFSYHSGGIITLKS